MVITNNPEDSYKKIQPVFGILITHFDIGSELLRAAESIINPQDNLVVLSNQNMGFECLRQQIQSVIPIDMNVIIMVDNFGGSTHIAAKAVCESNDCIALICGVNLPMLLSFITKRDRLDFPRLVEVVQEDAIRGIR